MSNENPGATTQKPDEKSADVRAMESSLDHLRQLHGLLKELAKDQQPPPARPPPASPPARLTVASGPPSEPRKGPETVQPVVNAFVTIAIVVLALAAGAGYGHYATRDAATVSTSDFIDFIKGERELLRELSASQSAGQRAAAAQAATPASTRISIECSSSRPCDTSARRDRTVVCAQAEPQHETAALEHCLQKFGCCEVIGL